MRENLDATPVESPKPGGLRLRPRPPRSRQHLCLDRGFAYDGSCAIAADFAFTLHMRREQINAKPRARVKARHWVVERTHSWPTRFRAVLIRWNRNPGNYFALLLFAFGLIAWRHALLG